MINGSLETERKSRLEWMKGRSTEANTRYTNTPNDEDDDVLIMMVRPTKVNQRQTKARYTTMRCFALSNMMMMMIVMMLDKFEP